jgi:hypothetical protein
MKKNNHGGIPNFMKSIRGPNQVTTRFNVMQDLAKVLHG